MILQIAMGVVGACLMLLVPQEPAVAPEDAPPVVEVPKIERMKLMRVVRVIDGDTIILDLNGKEARFELLGVNAPEYIERDPTPRRHARQAWFALHTLLDDEWVYVSYDPNFRRDIAGRLTGFVFRTPDMLFVNLEIIRQGYAEHTDRKTKLFQEPLAWWEQHARESERGIWGDEEVQIEKPPKPDPVPPPVELSPEPVDPIEPTEQIQSHSERSVYLTKSGSKYHTRDCQHYSPNCRRVPLSQARKDHQACSVCKPDEPEQDDGPVEKDG